MLHKGVTVMLGYLHFARGSGEASIRFADHYRLGRCICRCTSCIFREKRTTIRDGIAIMWMTHTEIYSSKMAVLMK